MAAPWHPRGAVHSIFHPDRPVPRGRPPAGRPGRAAAGHAFQPDAGPRRCGLRRRHQPLSARVAGGRRLPSGQRQRLLCHLVSGSPLHHGDGDVYCHAPGHRRRPDPRPHQRAGLRAGCGLQLLPHQPHPAAGAVRPERHRLGRRPRCAGRSAGHGPLHRRGRSAGAGRPAAAGRPALHP